MAEKLTKAQRTMLESTAQGAYTAYPCEVQTVLSLERRGLVTWVRGGGDPYGPGTNTARVSITPAGRAALRPTEGEGQ